MSGLHLGIIGIGHVGSQVLTYAVESGLFRQISVIDKDQDVARGEALDHHHATAMTSVKTTRVVAVEYDDLADADCIIVAAGPSITPDQVKPNEAETSRNLIAQVNAQVTREVMGNLHEVTRSVPIIFITNPLDVVVHIAATEFDYPTSLVFGTGTCLDSARLRRVIADRVRVDPDSVNAFMLGEHGATAFPWLSGASVGGVPIPDLPSVYGINPLDADQLAHEVVNEAFNVFWAKKWTNAGVAHAALLLARAVLTDSKLIMPISSLATGAYGYRGDVSLSLPAIIGAGGVERRLEVPLNEWEREHLDASARAIRSVYQQVSH